MISVFRYHVAHCVACIPGATYSFTHIHCEDSSSRSEGTTALLRGGAVVQSENPATHCN